MNNKKQNWIAGYKKQSWVTRSENSLDEYIKKHLGYECWIVSEWQKLLPNPNYIGLENKSYHILNNTIYNRENTTLSELNLIGDNLLSNNKYHVSYSYVQESFDYTFSDFFDVSFIKDIKKVKIDFLNDLLLKTKSERKKTIN